MNYEEIMKRHGGRTTKQPVKRQEFTSFPTSEPEESKSLFKSIAQGITSPFRRAGVQLYNVGSGIKKAAQGDIAGANAELDKTRDLGYFGETAPTLKDSKNFAYQSESNKGDNMGAFKQALDVAGQGAEMGSFFVGGSGAVKTAGLGFKGMVAQGVKEGAKTGFISGLTGGLGVGLQDEEATPGSVVMSTALGGAAGAAGGAVFGGVTGAVGAGTRNVINKFTGNYGKQADDIIAHGISKGIKPSVAGKKTPQMYDKFMKDSSLAIKYLTENVDNLNLTDDAGVKIDMAHVAKHGLDLDKASEAILRSKANVFKEYSTLSRIGGEAEAFLDLDPIAKELLEVGNNTAVRLKDPSLADEMLAMAARYQKEGKLSPQTAEEMITAFNKELKNFYDNPDAKMSDKMTINALIANKMRKGLDDTIQNATGSNYQHLKNIYGALSSLEKEVNHRAVVYNRSNTKGLADLTDVFSAGQVVQGLLSGDPSVVGSGLASRAIARTYKAMNNPNKVVKDMFKGVAKVAIKSGSMGKKLVTTPPAKTMLALPAPRAGSAKSVNNMAINLPARNAPIEGGTRVRTEVNPSRFLPAKSGKATGDFTQTISLPSKSGTTIAAEQASRLKKIGGKMSRRTTQTDGGYKFTTGKMNALALAPLALEKDENGKIKFNDKRTALLALGVMGSTKSKTLTQLLSGVRKVHPEDRNVIINFLDNVRLKGKKDVDLELDARRLAEHYKINPNQSNSKIADKLEQVMAAWDYLTRPKYKGDFTKKLK